MACAASSIASSSGWDGPTCTRTRCRARSSKSVPTGTRRSASGSTTASGAQAQLGEPHRAIVSEVRKIVTGSLPGVVEEIKWGQPCFSKGAKLAYLMAAKAHVTFGFFQGADLDDEGGLLEGSGKAMRSLKLRAVGDIPAAAIRRWLKQAATFG
jgi:hypothetical protein